MLKLYEVIGTDIQGQVFVREVRAKSMASAKYIVEHYGMVMVKVKEIRLVKGE